MRLYKNVLLIGAGSSLGAPVLAAFAARPEYNLTILTHHDSCATFPSGVLVIRANYISLNSLASTSKGQHAIISLIGGHALSSQNLFIDAAIRAGVKRFIPSQFGPNSRNEEFVRYDDVVLPVRAGIVDYLRYKEGQGDGKLSWTSVICSGFFNLMLYSGVLGSDLKSRIVEPIDNGTSVCTFTSLSTVGETVVKILDHADETRNHKNGSWNQRLELVEDEDIEKAMRDVLRGQGMVSE
ncbi:unnamed protein product [Alternaria sp. RS040]